jgi:hypothetical protein
MPRSARRGFGRRHWGKCKASRPGAADAHDGGQRAWLHLVEHLSNLRDPAPAGWLATTTRPRSTPKGCHTFSPRTSDE